jgi:hypothetical protein
MLGEKKAPVIEDKKNQLPDKNLLGGELNEDITAALQMLDDVLVK